MDPFYTEEEEEEEINPEMEFDDEAQLCSPSDKPLLDQDDEEGIEYLFEN